MAHITMNKNTDINANKTCTSCESIFAIGGLLGTCEPSLKINLDYFKNYKVPGGFKYIVQDTGEVKEVAIKQVIFSDPATIVFWTDNTKTTCKAAFGDKYNMEFAVLLCIAKKLFGSDNIFDVLNCWVPDLDESHASNKTIYRTLADARKLVFEPNTK